METMVKAAVETYGKLDILFNHAGPPGPTGFEGRSEDQFDVCMEANVKGGFFATQFAAREMRKTGEGGSIIFTSSCSGIRGDGLDVI